MENKKYGAVVIGGGPAGYTAAMYCARAGIDTLVLEMLSPGGQMATTSNVENYPGFEDGIDGFELGGKMQKNAEKFGAQTEYAEVISLDVDSVPKVITTTEGDILSDTVIIATGANPRKLGLEGEESLVGKGVAYCAYCDGMYYKDKTVAVIGGGDSAAEDALYLSKICKKVYLVHRRNELRAVKSYVKSLNNTENIELVLNAKPSKLIYDSKLNAVELEDTADGHKFTLEVDAVFAAVGRIPNTELVKDKIETDNSGYIVADETGRTNVPGVFAIGDVRTKHLRQIITAASDGANASKFVQEYIDSIKE